MINEETSLLEKRAELKRVINEGMEKTFPAYFFNSVGRGLVRVFRLHKMPHWSVNAVVLGMLVFLPGILVSVLTGEIYQWKAVHLFIIGVAALAFLAPVVSHINVVYNLLPGVRDDLVDAIQSDEDLNKLHSWLSVLWSFRKWMTFVVCTWPLFGIFTTVGSSLVAGSFIGIGLTVIGFSLGFFYVMPFYIIFHTLTLPFQLAAYRLELYESDPANSEIIQRLIYILNIYLYLVAGYTAMGTAVVSLNPAARWFVYFSVLVGWVPTIIQFIVNQYAVRKIIINAKWKNLNRLQAQIMELQKNNLKDVPETSIARINQLMDLHDRISAKPNSILNWGTGLSFLNQLLLPLLGLLLGNIDKLINLVTGNP